MPLNSRSETVFHCSAVPPRPQGRQARIYCPTDPLSQDTKEKHGFPHPLTDPLIPLTDPLGQDTHEKFGLFKQLTDPLNRLTDPLSLDTKEKYGRVNL